MARGVEMSDKSNKLKVESVVKWVPWDAKGSDDAREAARRVASVLQARAFFVTTILERKPANTMAEGMVGILLATNTTLVEELVYGFLRHSIDRKVKQRRVAGLIADCESDGVISAKTAGALKDLARARNEFVHADRGHVLPANSPRLTNKNLWRLTFHQAPIRLAQELRTDHDRRIANARKS